MSIRDTKVFQDSWVIAYREKKGDFLSDLLSQFTCISNPPNAWAADPFVFEYEQHTYVFAEVYKANKGKGTIGVIQLDKPKAKWCIVIDEQYHLSYPHVFRSDNDIYMMPEANQSESLYLYKAIDFPYKWEKQTPIREHVRYVDTSLFKSNNHQYAITYDVMDEENYQMKLLDLEDEANDKILDVDNIAIRRPGGMMDDTAGIRVAQDCSGGYGSGLIFYSYRLSNNDEYWEEEIKRVYPDQIYLDKKIPKTGIHTYNKSENYEIIDVKYRKLSFSGFVNRAKYALLRKARRLGQ